MNKYLVCLDTETTGIDKKLDHIVQLSAIKFDSETFEEVGVFNEYIIPCGADFNMSPVAQELHGLSKEFIKENGKYLKEVGRDFINFIDGCDILSYNGNTFDIGFIEKDFTEVGYYIDWSKYKSIDSFAIECELNPRKLGNVYKKYTGKDLDGAHDALADVRATIEVFRHQQQLVDIEEMGFINEITSPEGTVTYKDGKLVFSYGKYKYVDVYDVCKKDPGYIKWLFGTNISDTTKKSIQEYYKKIKTNK